MKKYADLSEQEKNNITIEIADYIIETKCSIRQASEYMIQQGINTPFVSVLNLMNKRLKKINEQKYKKILEMIGTPKSQKIKQAEIKSRVYMAVSLFLQDFNVNEIAQKLETTSEEIYDDLTLRYPILEPKEAREIQVQNLVGGGGRKVYQYP